MNKEEILQRQERKICDYLLKQENIVKIYEAKKYAWYQSFSITKDMAEDLIKTNNDPYHWSTREVIIRTVWFLSDMVEEFADEVEKLKDKTPKDKKIYQELDELPIDKLNSSNQKALFIILGYIYDNKSHIIK